MNHKLIDIGANLTHHYFASQNPSDIINSSFNHDISHLILTTTNCHNFIANLNLANLHQNVFTTIGLHPHYSNELASFQNFNFLEPKIKAIGEIGLDYHRMLQSKSIQQNTFNYFLSLSNQFDLPLFLHERDASSDFISLIKSHSLKNHAVVHCFTGDHKLAKQYLDNNFFIGITGWICNPKRNQDLLDAIKYIPLNRLMIETDSPFLKPPQIQGKYNYPHNLPFIAQFIATHLKIDLEYFSSQIMENTLQFFKL